MKWDNLSAFYNSGEWRGFRLLLIDERTNKTDGVTYCEECGKPFVNAYEIIAHHIQPLTLQNVNDYQISLNPANTKLVCGKCHNMIHSRFGYGMQKKVYLVTGAPCSGKTTFVQNNKGNSDLIIDIDSIWQCVTGGDRYHKPNALKTNAFAVRDCLLDMAKTRAGNWERCWIIEGLPVKAQRERKAALYGAEVIHIDTDKETCLRRLQTDQSRSKVIDEWERYIESYFAAYSF